MYFSQTEENVKTKDYRNFVKKNHITMRTHFKEWKFYGVATERLNDVKRNNFYK